MLNDDEMWFTVVFAIRFDVEICAVEFDHVHVRGITYVTRGLVTCAVGSRHLGLVTCAVGSRHLGLVTCSAGSRHSGLVTCAVASFVRNTCTVFVRVVYMY